MGTMLSPILASMQRDKQWLLHQRSDHFGSFMFDGVGLGQLDFDSLNKVSQYFSSTVISGEAEGGVACSSRPTLRPNECASLLFRLASKK